MRRTRVGGGADDVLVHPADGPISAPLSADLTHLLDLLDLIPPPVRGGKSGEFWQKVAAAIPQDWDAGFLIGCLAPFIERLSNGQGHLDDARRLAEHCLAFFDGDQPELWPILRQGPAGVPGAAGRRWAEAVSATAWRIYVEYEAAYQRRVDPLRRDSDTAYGMGYRPGESRDRPE